MKLEELFPLKGEITAEIIKNADIQDSKNCIGALTLKDALRKKIDPKDFEATWGAYNGSPVILRKVISIGTKEDINLMFVKDPQSITFILNEIL